MFIFLPNWEVWLVLLTAHAGNFFFHLANTSASMQLLTFSHIYTHRILISGYLWTVDYQTQTMPYFHREEIFSSFFFSWWQFCFLLCSTLSLAAGFFTRRNLSTCRCIGALVHFTNFFLKAGTAPGGGCLPRSVSLAGSAFQPLRPVSRQLSTDSGILALDAGIEQAPARISLPPHILFLICPVQSVCCESNLCEALQSDGWLISLSACCSWTGPTVASPSHLSSNEVKEVMLVSQLAIIMATTWSTHAEAESLGMGYAGAPKPSGE